MHHNFRHRCTNVLLLFAVMAGGLAAQGTEIIFKPVKVDGPVHDPLNHTYWFGPFSETASVADFDGDGDLDIAAAQNWYEAPLWIKHERFRDGGEVNGPETESNSEFAMDVNRDGRMDVVSSGWMFMKGAYWYENPGNKTDLWVSRRIHRAFNMEGVIHGDVDGDGDEDILVNHWALVPGQGMTWLEHIEEEPWFIEHVVGTQGDTHGNGLGDVNMDGRTDIVTTSGWYEQPADKNAASWPFHNDWNFEPTMGRGGAGSHPLLVHDVNEDGRNDIIIGSSHAYGLAWYENTVDGSGKLSFERHWIETQYSQFHTLALGDLNGDGKDDLVAGKRLFAHHGDDIGAMEPLYAFWYDLNGGDIQRHVLSFNHLPYYPEEGGINPPPNYVVSVGMKTNIADMDADGDNDVIISGKGGLYIFYNQGVPPTPGNLHVLAPESAYPTWREWGPYESLYNGKDFTGWRVPEGDGGHWKIVDGVIDYDAMSEAEDKHLYTEKSFRDYRLHLEWRFKDTPGLYDVPTVLPDGSLARDANGQVITKAMPNADSGVYLRGDPVAQVNLWCWPIGSGELYDVRTNESLAPALRAAATPKVNGDYAPGQWNQMDITLIGDRVWVMVNRKQVIENAQIPGISESGPIVLQHHGGIDPATGKYGGASSLVQFRNIWIDELDHPESEPAEAPDEEALARQAADMGITVQQLRAYRQAMRGPTAASELARLMHAEEGFVTLFDGRNLDAWLTGPNNAWVIEDGVLAVKREFDGQEHNADYLWTKEQYGDFVLELEFKTGEMTNSGVFLRTSDVKDPVYTGIEMQVSDSYSLAPIPFLRRSMVNRNMTAGALYDLAMPRVNAVRAPGEWNQVRVTCKGSQIKVELNGEAVSDLDLARYTTPMKNPDGSPNKFPTALSAFARSGHIGLQDHGRPVWYRNIRIKSLD